MNTCKYKIPTSIGKVTGLELV
eukprot:SAG22_NODE_14577_length_371_cov_0.669118_2_plen_21_part_01